jgi:membrane protease subunit HflK
MTIRPAWWPQLPLLMNDKPKSPWGSGGSDDDGPRNPWAAPPGGKPRSTRPTALDEFLRRARGPGGPSGGGGFPGLPSGANGRSLWLIGGGIIALLWILFTSVHAIAPQQRGVVTFFGRYSSTLEPGISLTLPAPIATVTKIDVQQIRTEDFPEGGSAQNLMLTGDQNIVDLAYAVRWDIVDPQDYLYQIKDARGTVRATAESAMRSVIATVNMNQAITGGRVDIEQRAQALMQQILDEYRSGVHVQSVAINKADPPASVIDDFKLVSAAQQKAQSDQNVARTYEQQVTARAQADAQQFDLYYTQYKLAPEVTRRRMYYETMEAVLAKNNKTIVDSGVVPYLPLKGPPSRVADAAPQANAAPATPGVR